MLLRHERNLSVSTLKMPAPATGVLRKTIKSAPEWRR
jgi:hypothetical protein